MEGGSIKAALCPHRFSISAAQTGSTPRQALVPPVPKGLISFPHTLARVIHSKLFIQNSGSELWLEGEGEGSLAVVVVRV